MPRHTPRVSHVIGLGAVCALGVVKALLVSLMAEHHQAEARRPGPGKSSLQKSALCHASCGEDLRARGSRISKYGTKKWVETRQTMRTKKEGMKT